MSLNIILIVTPVEDITLTLLICIKILLLHYCYFTEQYNECKLTIKNNIT